MRRLAPESEAVKTLEADSASSESDKVAPDDIAATKVTQTIELARLRQHPLRCVIKKE